MHKSNLAHLTHWLDCAQAPAVQASIETLLEQDEGESAIQYAPQTIRFCVLDDDVGETVDAALDEALTWNMT